MRVTDGIDGIDGGDGLGRATGMADGAGRRPRVPARALVAGMVLPWRPASSPPARRRSPPRAWPAPGRRAREASCAPASSRPRAAPAASRSRAGRLRREPRLDAAPVHGHVRTPRRADRHARQHHHRCDRRRNRLRLRLRPAGRAGLGLDAQHGTFILRLTSGTRPAAPRSGSARATRVTVGGLGIDLPVVPGGRSVLCDVAMYLTAARQPQEPGATFLYATRGPACSSPCSAASQVSNGASLIGRTSTSTPRTAVGIRYRIVGPSAPPDEHPARPAT